jgi:predicted phosphodiesterase
MLRRIAVLADVHGNVPALEAVLEDLSGQAVDEVLVGGDLVGRGPEGGAVVRRIRDLGWPCVRGNHENYLLGFRLGEVPAPWLHLDEWGASRWMAAELDDADVRYLAGLPLHLTARSAPGLRLVHGTPRSNNEGLGPWSTDEELEAHLAGVAESLLVCAHTHRPMYRRLERGLVVNVGAVGLPFNRDRRAQYAILRCEDGAWRAEFRQVDYDVERTLDAYERTGFLAAGGATAQLLRLELLHAAPYLVPFNKWTVARGLRAEPAQLATFLEAYDPDEPFGALLEGPGSRAGDAGPRSAD